MVVTAVAKNIIAFFDRKLFERITVIVIVQGRKMYESTPKFIDRASPTLKPLREVNHFFVCNSSLGIGLQPFFPVHRGGYKQIPTIRRLGKQINHPNH